jgi:NtrC-family two-component system response regulator AlgB
MGPQGLRVLVVDDERNLRNALALCLEGMGCTVAQASSAEGATAAVLGQPLDLVFLDLRLAHESGLDVLPLLLAEQPGLAVVVITAYATVETAVEALKRGARDYLSKPFTPEQIRQVVEKVAGDRALVFETRSPRMQATVEKALRAAQVDVPILIRGEIGVGKSVLARAIHANSPRHAHAFVRVRCSTDVEAAQGGTLFLDELGEMPPSLQAKLLWLLQEERMGGSRPRIADVRLIAATSRDLAAEVVAGRLRKELLSRVNVVEIPVPPLRERPEDILPLARHFLVVFARATRRQVAELSPEAERALLGYDWPGNVRELRNVMEQTVILWPAQRIDPLAFPDRIVARSIEPRLGGDFTVEQIERAHIQRVIGRTATLDEAARILGVDASTLWRKRKKYNR